MLGGVYIPIEPSIYRSINNFGMSSYFKPVAYMIANASSGDDAPSAFISNSSYGISCIYCNIISRLWFSCIYFIT